MKSITIETKTGTLLADAATDPNHPGIWVSFIPKGSSMEIEAAYIECKQSEGILSDGEEIGDICIYAYTDPEHDDYTDKHVLRKRDVERVVRELG